MVKTEYVTLQVADGTTMQAYVARPDDAVMRNGILVFQEAFGVNAHIRDVTERFAREGYIAIAPEMFHRTAPGLDAPYADFEAVRPHVNALRNETMSADIMATYEWVRSHSNGNIVAIGFCMGGRCSFLANTTVKLKASASFYGGGIKGLLDRIPDLSAPALLIWGGMDKRIPNVETRAIADALKAASKEYCSIEFSSADHGFFCDARSSYHPKSAAQAWKLVLEFFKTNLAL